MLSIFMITTFFINNDFKTHYICLCYKYRLTDEEFH